MDNERKRAVELEVSRKNAAAVLETLERQDHKIEQLVITLNSMNSAISSLLMRVQDLERTIASNRIRNMGNGPTVI